MIHIMAILLALFATPTVTTAQSEKAEGTNATSQALIDLENKWVEALAKPDVPALESILATTYIDTDERGHRSDRQELFSLLKSGDLKVESIKLSDMHVQIYGNAALVTGKGAQTESFKGQSIKNTILFTDTFVKQNGKWKAVASHRSQAS